MKKWLSKVIQVLKKKKVEIENETLEVDKCVDIATGQDYTTLKEIKVRKLKYLLKTVKKIRVKKKLKNRIDKIKNRE